MVYLPLFTETGSGQASPLSAKEDSPRLGMLLSKHGSTHLPTSCLLLSKSIQNWLLKTLSYRMPERQPQESQLTPEEARKQARLTLQHGCSDNDAALLLGLPLVREQQLIGQRAARQRVAALVRQRAQAADTAGSRSVRHNSRAQEKVRN